MTALTGRAVLPGYAMVLTLAVMAPLLSPGYLLIRDAVSTPRSYLSDTAIGLGESAPRAVPQDFAVAALTTAIDGGVVVKALLFAGLLLAGWGAGRLASALLPDAGTAGALVAATVAVWNPYVAERLLQGHWSLLLAYGCLPWVATTVLGLRTGGPPEYPKAERPVALLFWIALAGLTPTGAVLATIVALVCLAAPGDGMRRWRCAIGIAICAVITAAPWLTASLLGRGLGNAQSDGFAAFASRAEPLLGTLGSLAGLGGIWNAEAVPYSRTTGLALAATVLLLAVIACGVPTVLRRRTGEPLLVLAAAGVLIPAALATGPGLAALHAAVDAIPGLGVVRDAQKWVALAMPGYALAAAGAVLFLQRWMRPALAAVLCCAAVLAALPDLAWGVAGALRSVHYPAGWQAVTDRINAEPAPVAILPSGNMRQFTWAGSAPVLDPLPRWVRAEVLTTGDLRVAGRTVPGEGGRARAVERLLEDGADPQSLARAGVGWLVVERGTPGTTGSADQTLRHIAPSYSDPDLALYRIGGVGHAATPATRRAVMIAHLVWAGMLLGAAALLFGRWARTVVARIRPAPRVRLRRH